MIRYYLTNLRGTGARRTKENPSGDPFRASFAESGFPWGIIDLRQDKKVVEGQALAWADTPVPIGMPGVNLLGEGAKEKSVALRNILNARLGLSIDKDTLSDFLYELLVRQADKPLNPGQDGKVRIYLGGLIWGDEKPVYGHRTINDTFNRVNADALGASSDGQFTWQEYLGDTDIVSNQARTYGANEDCYNRALYAMASANHYAQAKGWPGGNTYAGVNTRLHLSAVTMYEFLSDSFGGAYEIYVTVGGVPTLLASDSTGFVVLGGGTLKGESDGTTQTLFEDGVQKVQATDGALSNVRTGFGNFSDNSASNYTIYDDFEASGLVTPGAGGNIAVKMMAGGFI